jgi:DNA-binding MarR family transcriptional regulator
VQIAERGRELVAVARRVEAEVEAEWTAHLGQETADQLRGALTRLREVTDPYR